MVDNLNFFGKFKLTLILLWIKDNLNFFQSEVDLNIFVNGRRPQVLKFWELWWEVEKKDGPVYCEIFILINKIYFYVKFA